MATPAPTPSLQPTTATATTTSTSKLTKTTNTLKYLYDPTNPSTPQPSKLRTRSLLRSARYITIFIFWRLFRYAKYAATGALVAAVSGTMIGSVVSGAAFVVAPTGILGGAGVGLLWAVARFGWRRAKASVGGYGGEGDAKMDERADAQGEEEEEEVKPIRVPRTEPW